MRTDNHSQPGDACGPTHAGQARDHADVPALDVLLDRDGTLIEDRQYASDRAQIVLLPGVAQALSRLVRAACRLFVVSNQSGVGRGYFSLESVHACNACLTQLLAGHGIHVADMLCCPHSPEEACTCRKPGTGMWELLRERHGLCPSNAAMIGDKLDDVRFGHAAGLHTVLVLTGKGREQAAKLGLPLPDAGFWTPNLPAPPDWPHAVAADLAAAVDFLMAAPISTFGGTPQNTV